MKITIESTLDGTVTIDRPDLEDCTINDIRDKLLIPMLAGMTFCESTIEGLFYPCEEDEEEE